MAEHKYVNVLQLKLAELIKHKNSRREKESQWITLSAIRPKLAKCQRFELYMNDKNVRSLTASNTTLSLPQSVDGHVTVTFYDMLYLLRSLTLSLTVYCSVMSALAYCYCNRTSFIITFLTCLESILLA